MWRWVARIPGWESECIVWNTAWRNLAGTNGRGVPVDVSQTIVEAEVGRGISLRTVSGEDSRFCSSRSSRCAAASSFKLRTGG